MGRALVICNAPLTTAHRTLLAVWNLTTSVAAVACKQKSLLVRRSRILVACLSVVAAFLQSCYAARHTDQRLHPCAQSLLSWQWIRHWQDCFWKVGWAALNSARFAVQHGSIHVWPTMPLQTNTFAPERVAHSRQGSACQGPLPDPVAGRGFALQFAPTGSTPEIQGSHDRVTRRQLAIAIVTFSSATARIRLSCSASPYPTVACGRSVYPPGLT